MASLKMLVSLLFASVIFGMKNENKDTSNINEGSKNINIQKTSHLLKEYIEKVEYFDNAKEKEIARKLFGQEFQNSDDVKDKKIDQLEEEVKQLQYSVDAKNKTISQLGKEVKQRKEEAKHKTKMFQYPYDPKEKRINQLEKEVKQLKEESRHKSKTFQNYYDVKNKKISQLEAEVKQLQYSADTKDKKIIQLEKDASERYEKHEQYKEEVKQVKDICDAELEKLITKLESTLIEKLKKSHEQIQEQEKRHSNQLKNVIKELEQIFKNRETENKITKIEPVNADDTKFEVMEDTDTKLKDLYENLRNTVQKFMKKIIDVENNLDCINNRVDKLTTTENELKKNIFEAGANLKSSENKLAETTLKQLILKTVTLQKLQNKITDATKTLEGKNDQVDKLIATKLKNLQKQQITFWIKTGLALPILFVFPFIFDAIFGTKLEGSLERHKVFEIEVVGFTFAVVNFFIFLVGQFVNYVGERNNIKM